MARIRTIKPEFFTSEDIVSLSAFARLLYISLWCEADREGRFAWKPRTFKLRYFPADSFDIDALAKELTDLKLVILYDEDSLAYIPSFSKHQHVNPRESASVLPAPVDKSKKARAIHASSRVSDAQGGREGNGKECIKPPTPLQGEPFAEFWNAWPKHPRKVAKPQCERKWSSTGCDAMLPEILAAVDSAKRSDAWLKGGGEFIPAPLVWLNQARWEAPMDSKSATVPSDAAEKTAAYLASQALTPEQRAASAEARRRVMEQLTGAVRTA